MVRKQYVGEGVIDKYEEIKQSGIEQLKNYLHLENLESNENLKAALIIFRNNSGEIVEVT